MQLEAFLAQQKLDSVLCVPSLADLEALEPEAKTRVYFIRCAAGPIKIGVAVNVEYRLRTLQVGCPYELSLMGHIRGGTRAESALHAAFQKYRFRGEWFMDAPELRKAVRALLGTDDQGRKRK